MQYDNYRFNNDVNDDERDIVAVCIASLSLSSSSSLSRLLSESDFLSNFVILIKRLTFCKRFCNKLLLLLNNFLALRLKRRNLRRKRNSVNVGHGFGNVIIVIGRCNVVVDFGFNLDSVVDVDDIDDDE
ncbi:hypothetical protein DERP_008320 [Dermatophagoides pteronyssinus]|uniref:Transmembrane protein n=1 Tax=Dermatophagoides pteronyssinus TaxID=6956 RepID=A0ABQ8J683_DERPT|nr:hypothetical protein DERP_008320 [Dermatophagoides pteronyssinus]